MGEALSNKKNLWKSLENQNGKCSNKKHTGKINFKIAYSCVYMIQLTTVY